MENQIFQIINMITKTFRYFICLMLILSAPLLAHAQGVPKAYEAINYQGKVNSKQVRFSLAEGYISASSLKMYLPGKIRPLVFEPDAGVADANNRLKFIPVPQGRPDYFILDNMQEAYDEIPAYIAGSYFFNNKKIAVKFWVVKSNTH